MNFEKAHLIIMQSMDCSTFLNYLLYEKYIVNKYTL